MSEGAVPGDAQLSMETNGATPAATTPESTSVEIKPSSWRESFGSDLANSPSLAKFDTAENPVQALGKSYVELQRKIGAKGVIIPGEDATEEELTEFHNALGRPETPEGYEILGNIEIPEGLPWSDETLGTMLTKMHEIGIPKQAAQRLVAEYLEIQGGQFQQMQAQASEAHDQAMRQLQRDWGAEYSANLDLANRAFLSGAGDDQETMRSIQLADGSRLGDHPGFIKMLANLGKSFSEGSFVGDKTRHITKTPEEAGREIRKLQGDKNFMAAWMDRDHPEHQDAVDRMDAAYQLAYPEGVEE